MKKIICIIIALVVSISAYASDNTYADSLNRLGLFSGTDNGYELDSPLTREQAAVMITRLLGAEKEASKTNHDVVFDDVDENRWSFPYVMYCYENRITNGTGKTTFSPEAVITADQFTALVLRVLGYETEPDTALDTAVKKMLLSDSNAKKLKEGDIFTRGDMVFIIYNAIKTKNADGIVLAYVLADKGAISDRDAKELDVYSNALDLSGLINSYF